MSTISIRAAHENRTKATVRQAYSRGWSLCSNEKRRMVAEEAKRNGGQTSFITPRQLAWHGPRSGVKAIARRSTNLDSSPVRARNRDISPAAASVS